MTDRVGAYSLIRAKLASAAWPAGGQPVFGAVIVTAAPVEWALAVRKTPIAVIHPGSSQTDPEALEEPNIARETLEIAVVVAVEGDRTGEHPVMGGPSPSGGSGGRGLLEIEREMLRTIRMITAKDGLEIIHRSAGAVAAQFDENIGFVSWRLHTFDMWVEQVADAPF